MTKEKLKGMRRPGFEEKNNQTEEKIETQKAVRPKLSVRALLPGSMRRLQEIGARTQDDQETILNIAIQLYHEKLFSNEK